MCGAQFSGIRAAAADLGQSVGSYTAAQFKEEYGTIQNLRQQI